MSMRKFNEIDELIRKKYLKLREDGYSKPMSIATIEAGLLCIALDAPINGEIYKEHIDMRFKHYSEWNEKGLNRWIQRTYGVEENPESNEIRC